MRGTADRPSDDTDPPGPPPRAGRKRDGSLDGAILDATLAELAESGYELMTIDKVAERAGTARASVYRRWASKSELALAAITRLSQTDVGLDRLPDTGTLRGDIVAMLVPDTAGEQQLRLRALTALLQMSTTDARLAQAVTDAGIGPWVEANRVLMRRAVARGEFPRADPSDIDTLARVVPMLCISRAVTHQPITHEFSLDLLDGVILPALRGGR